MLTRLIFVFFLCLTISADFVPILTLDAFVDEPDPLIFMIPSTATFPFSESQFSQSTTIFGGERDLMLTAESGYSGRVLYASVDGGLFTIAIPNGANAVVTYQLDGIDSSMNINPNGLGNFSLTFGGNATAFYLVAEASFTTTFTLSIYSNNLNSVSSISYDIVGFSPQKQIILPFADFSGNANFNSVGAIELVFQCPDKVDLTIWYFGIIGPHNTV